MVFLQNLLKDFEDDKAFERMCVEILQRDGYTNIQPVGGPNDGGRDAQATLHFSDSGTFRVEFQFSLDKQVTRKVRATLEAISSSTRQPKLVIFVFSTPVTPQRRDTLTEEALSKFGLNIQIKDQGHLTIRLAQKPYHDITTRYFAQEIASLKQLWDEDALFSDSGEQDESQRRSLINLMLYGTHPLTEDFRQELIAQVIKRVLASSTSPIPQPALIEFVRDRLPTGLMNTQPAIETQLQHLQRRTEITPSIDGWVLNPDLRTQVRLEAATLTQGRNAIHDAIRGQLRDTPIGDEALRDTTSRVLAELFRKYGTEVSGAFLDDQASPFGTVLDPDALDSLLAKMLPVDWLPNFRRAYCACFKSVLACPSLAATGYLNALSRSYILMQLLRLDPDVVSVQFDRMRNSTVVLDTDVVLTAIVDGAADNGVSTSIIELCSQAGITFFCGVNVVEEIRGRIERSITHFNDLGRPASIPTDKLQLISDIFLDIYFRRVASGQTSSFEDYMSRYYSPDAPTEKVRTLITGDLDIPLQELQALLLVEQEEKLNRLRTTIESSRKAANRFKHPRLYDLDALQMLIVEQRNRDAIGRKDPGRWYLVSSDRHILNAYLQHKNSFKVKPCVLPSHFLERLRNTPGTRPDSASFAAILHSETMLRGAGRDYTPVIAALTRIGVKALDMPTTTLLAFIEDMDRADFTSWLFAVRNDPHPDAKMREDIAAALERLARESESKDQELKDLRARYSADRR